MNSHSPTYMTFAILICLLCVPLTYGQKTIPEKPPGTHFPLSTSDHKNLPSYRQRQPIVGTTYFYWYDIETKAHIIDHDGTDALTTHPADLKTISYKSVSWHKQQLLDMMDAGIDFLMPVYWGVPGDYKGWSFAGIPPLVQAHDELQRAGKKPPRIGLFYDTSILRYNRSNPDGSTYHVDLTTEYGKQWFYTAIRDFFSLVPPSKWARIDGKPIVFLYSANFAKAQDPAQMDYVYKQFKKNFGLEPFLVKHRDWQGKSDAIYQWGGAVRMQLDTHVAALGPGYDHTAVPGRSPLIVLRENGKTYTDRWDKLLSANPNRRPWIVHVETWNEWHEGTDIAHSREYGRLYINLTRQYADLWRQGIHQPIQGPYLKTKSVSWQPEQEKGITLRPSSGDGFWKIREVKDKSAVAAVPNEVSPGRFLYFLVDDSFIFDGDLTTEITITYLDAGCDSFQVEYDNVDATQGPVQGAFRASNSVKLTGSGTWKTATIQLPQSRFVNRANGADFRLTPLGGKLDLTVSKITLRK
jgi:uncharacterized protein DUF5010